ncbi:hypothetical protein BDZ45DRAFT_677599 [Acephala macrosclerotiorum]|nr:hypothetical protein BDZ45DRAFT_677599 [Acephala macrosclerotiorum]
MAEISDLPSLDQCYILRAKVDARIRSLEAEFGTADQAHLLHGGQPPTESYSPQSITPNSCIDGRFHHLPENLEATVQTEVKPVSGGIPRVSAHLNLGISMNQEIETLGLGQDPFPPQLNGAKAPALVQPQQNWASEAAAETAFPENDSLSFENCPPSTLGSLSCGDVSQPQFRGQAQDVASNTYRSSPAETDFTWQHGATTASMTSNFAPTEPMPQPDTLLHFQPYAAIGHSLYGSLPELNEFEPAPNEMRAIEFGASQPATFHQYSQASPIYERSEDVSSMDFRLAEPGLKMIEGQKSQGSGSRSNTQARTKLHDKMGNASNMKSGVKKRKAEKKFPDRYQKRDANQVRMNGGACARCRKERIKCIINPRNPDGPCLTCPLGGATLDRQPECLRGKIIEVVLFRKYVDPDYRRPEFSENFDTGTGILKPVKGWDSEVKSVELTRGFGPTIRLAVRKAKAFDQTDIPESQRFIYECLWAFADFPEAVKDFRTFLWTSIEKEITNRIQKTKRPIAFSIVGKAYQLAIAEEGPSVLLQKVLMVWSGSRHIEGGWHFHGSETLDLQINHEGKVPLTAAPILDAEVSSIIVKYHVAEARELALKEIQRLLDANNATRRKRMFELFLAYFILLDNCECIMKHQRKWAMHNNSPFWYTPQMVELVEGILRAVKMILRVWRSDLKGQFIFNPDWDPNYGPKIADFTGEQLSFIKGLGKRLSGKETSTAFNRLFQNWGNYDRDYCFTGQLFVPDWPQMPTMPKSPPAPKPARPARPGINDPIRQSSFF